MTYVLITLCKLKSLNNAAIVTVVLGLVDVFKSGREWSHMRDFIYTKCCAKGFSSEVSILDDKWLLKIA